MFWGDASCRDDAPFFALDVGTGVPALVLLQEFYELRFEGEAGHFLFSASHNYGFFGGPSIHRKFYGTFGACNP
jgi:hypothetical protein